MDSNRMETVKRVTSAITGAPSCIAIRGARKIDARGVREHFWLTSADGVIAATGTDEEEFATPYGFAVMKGKNHELIEMFNAGNANIRESGEYDEIVAK